MSIAHEFLIKIQIITILNQKHEILYHLHINNNSIIHFNLLEQLNNIQDKQHKTTINIIIKFTKTRFKSLPKVINLNITIFQLHK